MHLAVLSRRPAVGNGASQLRKIACHDGAGLWKGTKTVNTYHAWRPWPCGFALQFSYLVLPLSHVVTPHAVSRAHAVAH